MTKYYIVPIVAKKLSVVAVMVRLNAIAANMNFMLLRRKVLTVSEKSIEKKYGVWLERDKGYDGGAWYWLCFDSQENMEWVCNGYTLAEIEEKLQALKGGANNE
jgi:hypothetical protein